MKRRTPDKFTRVLALIWTGCMIQTGMLLAILAQYWPLPW